MSIEAATGPAWDDPAGQAPPLTRRSIEALYDMRVLCLAYQWPWHDVRVEFTAAIPDEIDFGGGFARMEGGTGLIVISVDSPPADAQDAWLAEVTDTTDAIAHLLEAEPELSDYVNDPEIGLARLGRRIDRLRQMLAHEAAHAIVAGMGVVEDDEHGPRWRDVYWRLCTGLGCTRARMEEDALEALCEPRRLS